MSLIILALYFWAYFANVESISAALLVSDGAAILAGITILAGSILYLWVPKNMLFQSALAVYLLLTLTTAYLIVDTGGITSPFVALWMLVAIFSGVFSFFGITPLLLAVTGYVLYGLYNQSISQGMIVPIVLAGILPLFVSYLIWHHKSGHDSSKETAYRALANELSQVAGKSEVVINAIADGVIAVDAQGTIQLINPAAQKIIGWGKQDALALDYKSVLHLLNSQGKDVEPSEDPVHTVLSTNASVRSDELGLLTNSEKKILVSVIVSPVGQPGSGAIIVFRDITSEKAEERQQAEFISTASHEMRTPVASIEGYLGLALNANTATVDVRARDYIGKAHEAAQHLGRLFQDLLDVTKADDGRLQNTPRVIDVVALTQDIVQGQLPKAQEKGLRVLFKPHPDMANDKAGEKSISPVYYAHLDSDHLREVVGNLVENAIKYTPKGDVVIDVTGDNDHVVISVADTGIGIPAEDIPHLFQKFYRVDNTDTREIGGTGLGLYLCRRLVEAIGGRLWVESEYKKGSTFFVEIPRIDHEKATMLIEEASLKPEPEAQIMSPAWQVTPPAGVTPPAQPKPAVMPQNPPAYQPNQRFNSQLPPLSAAPTISSIEQNKAAYVQPRAPGANRPSASVSVPDRSRRGV